MPFSAAISRRICTPDFQVRSNTSLARVSMAPSIWSGTR